MENGRWPRSAHAEPAECPLAKLCSGRYGSEMNETGNPQSKGAGDDPWEQLAEDLFGTEYGKEHAAPESLPEVPVAPTAESVVTASEIYRAPEPPTAVPPVPVAPPTVAEPVADFEEGPPETAERPKAASPQDSYWDALANWTWDEGSRESSRSAPESRGEVPPEKPSHEAPPPRQREETHRREETRRRDDRGSSHKRGRPERGAPPRREPPPTPAPSRPKAEESGDFGAGVAGEAPAWSQARAEPVSDFAESAGIEDDAGEPEASGAAPAGAESRREETSEGAPRKRRRRRRRRGGHRDEGAESPRPATPAQSSAEVPGDDWAEPEPRAAAREPRQSAGAPDRSGPARSAPREPVAADEDDFAAELLSDSASAEASPESDDDVGESIPNYADIPTWEEAISYLLNPQQVQVEAGGGHAASSGRSNDDQPRQTRHYSRKPRN